MVCVRNLTIGTLLSETVHPIILQGIPCANRHRLLMVVLTTALLLKFGSQSPVIKLTKVNLCIYTSLRDIFHSQRSYHSDMTSCVQRAQGVNTKSFLAHPRAWTVRPTLSGMVYRVFAMSDTQDRTAVSARCAWRDPSRRRPAAGHVCCVRTTPFLWRQAGTRRACRARRTRCLCPEAPRRRHATARPGMRMWRACRRVRSATPGRGTASWGARRARTALWVSTL